MKKFLCLLSILIIMSNAIKAVEYEEMGSFIKPPAYRVGTSDEIEPEFKIKKTVTTKSGKINQNELNTKALTYADLSIKQISMEFAKDLELSQTELASDLSILWQGAATKSDTIKFALYKLSNPDADKPDDKSVKKVLKTIAGMSTLLGAGIGNPMIATGAFLGGNMLGTMTADNKELNYKYTRVNDADMIILVRKINNLQQNVVDRYYDYMTAKQLLDMYIKMTNEAYNNYKLSQNGTHELVLITDAYYRESLDLQTKARNRYYSTRSSLEQLVGQEAFKTFESNVGSRKKR